jgi:hypothetical protein
MDLLEAPRLDAVDGGQPRVGLRARSGNRIGERPRRPTREMRGEVYRQRNVPDRRRVREGRLPLPMFCSRCHRRASHA